VPLLKLNSKHRGSLSKGVGRSPALQFVFDLRVHRGDGFRQDCVLGGIHPRLKIEVPGLPCILTEYAQFSSVFPMDEGAPLIGIPAYYAHVVDALLVQELSSAQIANILQTDVHLVDQYLNVQAEYHEWVNCTMNINPRDAWLSVHWHEVHALFIENPAEDTIKISLEHGRDTMVGFLELDLRDMNPEGFSRKGFSLTPQANRGLASWLFRRRTETAETAAETICKSVMK